MFLDFSPVYVYFNIHVKQLKILTDCHRLIGVYDGSSDSITSDFISIVSVIFDSK